MLAQNIHPDLTVIICTRDRADSLRVTLQSLAATDHSGITLDVLVVDNGSTDDTRSAVDEFGLSTSESAGASPLRVRYLFEPTIGNYGKSHALNRALAENDRGRLIAILDDDFTVEPHWCRGALAIANRWPDAVFFSGRSYVIWPDGPIPPWAHHPRIQGWIFSVQEAPKIDVCLGREQWYLGGYFWFRSSVLHAGRRFEDLWATEPCFMLQLVAEGGRGVRGPDAAAGHRIQRQLLEPDVAVRRAGKVGEAFARVRLDPRFELRHSRLARGHPWLARGYVLLQLLRWSMLARLRSDLPSSSLRFGDRLVAIEREANFRETWRILRAHDHPLNRVPSGHAPLAAT